MEVTISTIISSFNEAAWLPICLNSILDQSVQPVEIIVLDDASTDDSRDMLRQYAEHHPQIKPVFMEKQDDWLETKFKACLDAKGTHIDLCCADNFTDPGWYEEAVAKIERNPSVGYIYASSHLVGPNCDGIPHPCKGDAYVEPGMFGYWFGNANPGGAASILSTEAMRFLVERKVWTLGPWSDAVGYYVAACLFGAIVFDGTFGAVRRNLNGGHGGRVDKEQVKQGVLTFLDDPDIVAGIDAKILDRLRRKV